MTITALNDINSLYNVSSDAVKSSLTDKINATDTDNDSEDVFGTFLNAAVSNITDTNEALSNKENEELKWAMGISEDSHDLTVAVGKAETALSYTVALRDKLLDAYKEIMQIQI
jgi:flagellar hook-basal body complex protein FliE